MYDKRSSEDVQTPSFAQPPDHASLTLFWTKPGAKRYSRHRIGATDAGTASTQSCNRTAPLLPYWLLFSAFATGAVTHLRHGEVRRQATPLLTIAVLIAALMIGFRYESGADWDNYIQLFLFNEYLSFGEAILTTDPGYGALNWFAIRTGLEFWAVNLVCGAILSWGLLKFAKSQPNPWLAIVVAVPYLLIVVGMGYSRQAVAVGFILAGLANLEKSSLARFAFYIFCAAMFHKTAVVVLPLVALASVRNRLLIAANLGLFALVLGYVLLSGDLDRLNAVYIDAEYGSEGAGIRVGMNLLPAALFLMFQRRFVSSEAQRLLWRNFSYASVFMLFLLAVLPSSTVVDRLALYLIPLQIFVFSRLPIVFSPRQNGGQVLVLAVIIYSATIQYVWMNYAGHSHYWMPYKAYFISEDKKAADDDPSP